MFSHKNLSDTLGESVHHGLSAGDIVEKMWCMSVGGKNDHWKSLESDTLEAILIKIMAEISLNRVPDFSYLEEYFENLSADALENLVIRKHEERNL